MGRVFEQAIGAGALVMPGTQVEFFLPTGALPPAVAVIPNVVSKTTANAQAILTSFGFVPQVVEIVGPMPYGVVVFQSPAGSTGAALGTVVTIRVHKAPFLPTTVAVPNLIGRTGAQANALLAAVGLGSNGSIAFNISKPLGKVYSQNYIPGTMVAVGTQITWRRNP
jgi:beta-lactam-binding protein with PASTA domain